MQALIGAAIATTAQLGHLRRDHRPLAFAPGQCETVGSPHTRASGSHRCLMIGQLPPPVSWSRMARSPMLDPTVPSRTACSGRGVACAVT